MDCGIQSETLCGCVADKGTVLKVISVPKESWNNMEDLLLEELEVFKVRGPCPSFCWRQRRLVGGARGGRIVVGMEYIERSRTWFPRV